MNRSDVLGLIRSTGIVAIMRGIEEHKALRAAEALLKGGVKAIEVTFNTPGADRIIMSIHERFKEAVIVGAGTVTNPASAVRAIDCGAEFILAPNTDPEVIATVKRYGKIMVPGAFTATEVLKCYDYGADIVKIFPVSSVGPQYIGDLRGPYDYIELMAVGGVNADNVGKFIKSGAAAVGAGGSLLDRKQLDNDNYRAVEELARRFTEEIRAARQ
ncbi:MAG TPA: bifunctional 4-hydroxy-2-oxoglutarate aldolase/2-dehydro-3-deoxy-phosphogluconate aldolase [Clostridia bacterium]|nr:bifunctional 4-hydroxy-2-oxoglutarate aldolase/2-dehydro-3-deoxy-phosphogluconate aldolase [Clostridia bacterium]